MAWSYLSAIADVEKASGFAVVVCQDSRCTGDRVKVLKTGFRITTCPQCRTRDRNEDRLAANEREHRAEHQREERGALFVEPDPNQMELPTTEPTQQLTLETEEVPF